MARGETKAALTAPGKDGFEEVAAGKATLGAAIGRLVAILLRPELQRWRGLVVLALAITIIAKVLAVASPLFLGEAINGLAAGLGAGNGPSGAEAASAAAGADVFGPFLTLVLIFSGLRLASLALPQIRDAFFVIVTQDAARVISVDGFAHAQSLSLQFHLTRRAGALSRIIERGAAGMEYLLRFLAFTIAPTLIELTLAAIVLGIAYGWGLSLAAVVTVVIYTVFTIVVTEWRTRQRRLLNTADTDLKAGWIDSLANFETVKAFAAETREANRFDRALRAYNTLYVKLMQSLAVLNIGQEVVMAGGLLAALLIAGAGAVYGDLGPGDATAVMLMLLNIYRPLNILGFAWREIRQGVVDMEKLFGLMAVNPDVPDAPGAPALLRRGGEVRFETVSFVHEGRANGLDGVEFTIPAGAFVGLAGPSGAGKSTILRLLFRFYDPASGRVLIDGQDLRAVTQASVRSALGLVPQEVVLFNDTLRYNLAYARPDASEAEILEAAERAQLTDFIARLPDGLATRVGERGLKLSGGEKQRVGLARAILADPLILVLDEATSSLDSETEAEVQAALAEAAKGRTTIAVAHRLSTLARADLILVLEDGRIVERGRHDDLVAAGGRYAAMWSQQSGGNGGAAAQAMPAAREPVPAP